MKKLSIILLIALYGLSASGMAIQLHYCCGKVAGMSLGYEKSSKASCKHGKQMKMAGCCNDQQVQIDTSNDQGIAGGVVLPAQAELHLPVQSIVSAFAFLQPVDTPVAVAPEPSPPPGSVPIYLYNKVFRN
ncbi:MAG TPA: hypothetical protein VLC98_15015 [Phnomibacter sp.]|nr:hypothetical protein [Phnomibacter sp.]